MRVPAADAARSGNRLLDSAHKHCRYGQWFAASVVEDRGYQSATVPVLVPQIHGDGSVPAAKENRVIQSRTLLALNSSKRVRGDEQVIGVPEAKYLNTDERGRQHDGVQTVYADRFDSLEPGQTTTLHINETAVGSKFRDGSNGFHAVEYVAVRQILVFDGNGGLAIDARLAQSSERVCRQTQPAQRRKFVVV